MSSSKRSSSQEERYQLEQRRQRRIVGILLVPIILFPLLSLVTYNWRDISDLNTPPLTPPANLIGIVGAWSVYIGYSVLGLAIWVLPPFVLLFCIMLLNGHVLRLGRRAAWLLLFVLALCCLLQLGSTTIFSNILDTLNLQPNAGGAIGYFVMQRWLAHWFSPVGGGLLMSSIMLLALLMAIGTGPIFHHFGRWAQWWRKYRQTDELESATHPEAELTPEEKRAKRLAQREAQKKAKEAAALARQQERERKKEKRKATIRAREEAKNKPLMQADNAKTTRLMEKIAAARASAQKERGRSRGGRSGTKNIPPVALESMIQDAPAQVPAEYRFPPVSLLNPLSLDEADHGNTERTAALLVETLAQFKVPVEIVGVTPGPVITQYELKPAPSIKVERIAGLTANLQMALKALSLRVLAPIPGKHAVGIEVPNRRAQLVTFRELMESHTWQKSKYEIPLALGKDVAGKDLIIDLAKAPHLLVAGATGAGKSACLNAILNGLLMSRTPEQVRLILVDPKRVEFTSYNNLPHLLVPVINESKKVASGLAWSLREMERRYRLLQKVACRNIITFNRRAIVEQPELFNNPKAANDPDKTDEVPAKLPYIVIIIDEVADIMAAVGKEVEPAISRLASLSRAVGIHLILATQRPSVDVITGTIKANIPGRIAFKVSQANDSRTILDSTGAEELIGKGDMLLLEDGSRLTRAQGAWVADEEISRIVEFVKEHNPVEYDAALLGRLAKVKESEPADPFSNEEEGEAGGSDLDDADEALIPKAIEVIRITERASTSMVQRRLRIGYTRAARIMETLEERGIVGPMGTRGTREILIDLNTEITSNIPSDVEKDDDIEEDTNSTTLENDTEL